MPAPLIMGGIAAATALVDAFGPLLARWFPDQDKQEAAKAELLLAAQSADMQVALAQIALNVEEARGGNLLARTWRPACGWMCVITIGMYALYDPLMWAFAVAGWKGSLPPRPDATWLMPILVGMLGFGGYRTFEKVKGVAR